VKERLVICNEEDTDGRARVTRDEEPLCFVTLSTLVVPDFCTSSLRVWGKISEFRCCIK